MLRALCLSLIVLGLPMEVASADAPYEAGANAALKYWQAFATMPHLTDAEQKKLGESLSKPVDDWARETVTKADYSLQMMHRAASLPRCDWGIGYEEQGVHVRLPHAQAARVLSALACLRARIRFEEGRAAEAVDDLVATLALSRHVSRDGVIIVLLVGYAIEHRVHETLALDLPKLDAGAINDLKKRLDSLPPGGTSATGMAFDEKFALDWLVRKVKGAPEKDRLLAVLGQLCDSPEKGRVFLDECGGSAESLLKFAEATRQSYAQMAKKLALPPDQFEQEYKRVAMEQAGNPVFKTVFPAMDKVRRVQARADVRRALMSAALDVQLSGRDALKNHPDPVAGGPFEFLEFPGGFELRSKLKHDDTTLNLVVGRRGK